MPQFSLLLLDTNNLPTFKTLSLSKTLTREAGSLSTGGSASIISTSVREEGGHLLGVIHVQLFILVAPKSFNLIRIQC